MIDQMPAPASLYDRLEPLLASVAKPVQYVGGEVNSVVKNWSDADVRWVLMYPDAYAVGQPNWLGVLSIDQSIRAIQGQKVDKEVTVPLPEITDANLDEFVPNDFPDDGYPIKMISQEQIDAFLKPKS